VLVNGTSDLPLGSESSRPTADRDTPPPSGALPPGGGGLRPVDPLLQVGGPRSIRPLRSIATYSPPRRASHSTLHFDEDRITLAVHAEGASGPIRVGVGGEVRELCPGNRYTFELSPPMPVEERQVGG
jgi:hypothetical protein